MVLRVLDAFRINYIFNKFTFLLLLFCDISEMRLILVLIFKFSDRRFLNFYDSFSFAAIY